jgi:hypothetical protein
MPARKLDPETDSLEFNDYHDLVCYVADVMEHGGSNLDKENFTNRVMRESGYKAEPHYIYDNDEDGEAARRRKRAFPKEDTNKTSRKPAKKVDWQYGEVE